MVVVFAVGTADEGGGHAGDGSDLFVAGGDVGDDLVGGEGVIVVVVVGVVHDLVAGVVECLDGLGVFLHPVTHHEKGGFHVIAGQNVDELSGVLIAPGGVEGDGAQGLTAFHRIDGELARRGPGRHGGGKGDGGEEGGREQQGRQDRQVAAAQEKDSGGERTHGRPAFLICYADLYARQRRDRTGGGKAERGSRGGYPPTARKKRRREIVLRGVDGVADRLRWSSPWDESLISKKKCADFDGE